jgi:hypothetical protein
MEVAELLRLPGDVGRVTSRTLNIAVLPEASGQSVLVRRAVAEAQLLTAVRQLDLDWELPERAGTRPVVTRDNPFLDERVRQKLDPSGLMPQGATFAAGDVIFSAYRLVPETQQRQPPPEGMRWAEDSSESVPAGWEGSTLTWISHRPAGRGSSLDRIDATLRAEDELDVGDALLLEHGLVAIVAGFISDAAEVEGVRPDLLVSAELASRMALRPGNCRRFDVSRLPQRAADALQAHAGGATSLITRQPLGRGPQMPQEITHAQVRWLRSRRLNANLSELVCLKCDDWRPRKRRTPDVPASPESLWRFQAHLRVLGLSVELIPVDGSVQVALRPATTEEVRGWSSGPIRNPNTLNYRTLRPEPGGLFCEEVFGPETHTRLRSFGHLELPVPVVPLSWRRGAASLLEALLGLSADEIERVVTYQSAVVRRGIHVELVEPDPLSHVANDYLGTGGAAVRALLADVPADRLPAGLAGRPTALTLETLSVMPADLRPLVLLDSGNFATSDLNDLYRRVVNRALRLVKLQELNAPQTILLNEGRMLQQTVDALFANCLLPERGAVHGDNGRRLRDALDLLLASLSEDRSKRVAWSGRARAIEDPTVAPDEVRIPERLRAELCLAAGRVVLLTNPDSAGGTFVALRATGHGEAVLRLPTTAFARLQFSREVAPSASLHVPLSDAAEREAEALLNRAPGELEAVPADADWIDASEKDAMLAGLCAAALSAEPLRLDSPRGLMLAGLGVVDTPEDVPTGRLEGEVRPVPVNREPPPARPRRRRLRE